jgi:hypothetical protein
MTAKTWQCSSSGAWNVPGNWNGGLPAAGDEADITQTFASAAYTVDVSDGEGAEHAVVLAGGPPAESNLDSGARCNFDNGGEPVVPHPNFPAPRGEARGCAPLVLTGPKIDAWRQRLHSIVPRNKAWPPDAVQLRTRMTLVPASDAPYAVKSNLARSRTSAIRPIPEALWRTKPG